MVHTGTITSAFALGAASIWVAKHGTNLLALKQDVKRSQRTEPEVSMYRHSPVFKGNQISFHGTPLASGTARGLAYLLKKLDLQQLQGDRRTVGLIALELARLDLAVERSREQIAGFRDASRHNAKDSLYPIFEAEFRLLNDPGMVASVKEIIGRTSLPSETVLAGVIARMHDDAAKCPDTLKVKTLTTMQDLYYRVLYNMHSSGEDRIPAILQIPQGSILVADRLTPVEVAIIPIEKVAGIIIEEGTRTSHAAILAGALGIPVIIDVPGIGSLLTESTMLLIDAWSGKVFLNPSPATLAASYAPEHRHATDHGSVKPAGDDASEVYSTDGIPVHLLCNASNLSDIIHAHNLGIKEIGLFRSEIRYLATTVPPTPEQEVSYYTGLFAVEGMMSMTIRLLDIGGDKLPVYMYMEGETDPQLGCRGIRLLLSRPELMKKQLRAILSARGTSTVRLLLPFVTTIDDISRTRTMLGDVAAEMNLTGHIPAIGIMVEVPSVALSIEHFLPKVDFVCLGTNDLAQYFFAVNREQADLQQYCRFTHPSFLSMINNVIAACARYGTELSVCGEMAADAFGCALLAAAGATRLSVQPDAVPLVHGIIPKVNLSVLRNLLPYLLNRENADDVENELRLLGIGT